MVAEDDTGLMDQLIKVRKRLGQIEEVTDELGQLFRRIETMCVELMDIQSSFEDQLVRIDHDPQHAEQLESLLDSLYRLQNKHGFQQVDDLIALRNDLSQRIINSGQIDDRIQALEIEIEGVQKSLNQQASLIHDSRLATITKLEDEILTLLNSINFKFFLFNLLNVIEFKDFFL